jgi:hypothetical protein
MTDSSAVASKRPRPALLVILGAAVAALAVYSLWPAARGAGAPSNSPREQRKQAGGKGAADVPGSLQVQLDALTQPPPAPDADASRNPFRFYVKPPPPPPPPPKAVVVPPPAPPPVPGDEGYRPPPPPPIPLKFIGTLEGQGKKVAIFQTERQGLPIYAAEGETVLGQYRVVKIGVESVTMEYLDGRGRQVIPMRG